MLYVDIPSSEEFSRLSDVRSDACISIYLETSPLRQQLEASKIQLGNFITKALLQVAEKGLDKRRLVLLEEELLSVLEDPDFWDLHARSLVILATPDSILTYRLANELPNQLEVGERFYLKPLLRALTFPHSAYILALSENQARLIEFFADVPALEVTVPNMPSRKRDAMGDAALNDHHHGAVHHKVRLAQYTRQIDQALRPIFANHDYPLILVSTEPLASIYRSTNSLPNLTNETLSSNVEHLGVSELVTQVRPLLENYYQAQLNALKARFETRAGERRVTQELSDAARAATFGAIDTLLINIDSSVNGSIDDEGLITFSGSDDEISYGVIDEIAKRALATGAKVLAVRSKDLPHGADLNAILRYPL
ncbi:MULTISPECIES: baeRF11 domain-containing protein [unclassified Serratia (in: enterobacteria)]|uniref:baeRF11 domain-containing protein n=1 Tax=unclassified Serratia (in: enterobacteria) TaxID=2647522 RepID=UPI003076212B